MSLQSDSVAALLAEASERKELISFGGGGPSLPPPAEVTEEITRRIKEDPQASTGVLGTRGFLELRKLIADDWVKHDGEVYNPEKEVNPHRWRNGSHLLRVSVIIQQER